MEYKQALFRMWLVFAAVWMLSTAPGVYNSAGSYISATERLGCGAAIGTNIKSLAFHRVKAGCDNKLADLIAAVGTMILPPFLLLGLARASHRVLSRSEAA